ncbi:PABP-dependent poly(A) nuclease 3 [Zopfia rhizophila CBS 207.26]|uniref:PAN2-PAN3 deadenylation complex subunit PAN3 n=1 Tax=Zopfia rhizophila CBS 207.26 TaxID=1314779 RepID=A0A6A6EUI3_9PEZI|nr:PABP-dependent poly(A) nuclease 3 [Zopfia rhizophila CBS 207.26]
MSADTCKQREIVEQSGIQPVASNKAESLPTPAQYPTTPSPRQLLTDAYHTTDSDPSSLDSYIEITSSLGRSALAHETTTDTSNSNKSQKQLGTFTRAKSRKTNATWSNSGNHADDIHLDRRGSLSRRSGPSSYIGASSPQPGWPAHRQRSHPKIALNNLSSHKRPLMATTFGTATGDSRRGVSSPRPKGREAKNTFCRNVTIYGHCRYENTCPYIHDPSKLNQNENMKKRFNVDSPSFTPLQASTNGSLTPSSRSAAISPKAANAAVFTPKSQRSTASTPSLHTKEPALEWHPQEFQEFVPQTFESQMVDPNASTSVLSYDPFNTSTTIPSITGSGHQASSLNPYAQDPTCLSGASYYQNANTFQGSPSFHLYWPIGPQPTNLLAYQRTAHDFFIPEALREDLQKKSEVARQILPNSSLPPIEQYHSLVCLDTTQHKNQSLFGYQSWVYKAVSSKDGNTYALRRLEGFRLTNENAIRSVQPWKRVFNGSVVTIHDAFTTRAFGDSSLILVTDYHPCSKSLAEEHFKTTPMSRFHGGRQATSTHIPEQAHWGYIVQIASALKAIHGSGLAARLITPSKVLLTSRNRVRLNACAVLDVVQYENARPLAEIQAEDLIQLGRLILCIANNNPNAHLNMQKSMEHITRSYTGRLKECVQWLLSPQAPPGTPTSPTSAGPMQKDIDTFLAGIADQFASVFDSTLHAEDTLISTLGRELESSRLVRLLIKLNFINERPELDASIPVPSGSTSSSSAAWAETGERYYLKLFRDYVFHQVDANGHPVTNLAHVLECLNKLDAGSEEKIALVSRDEQNVLIVSYRELKRGVEGAFQDLVKAGRSSGR